MMLHGLGWLDRFPGSPEPEGKPGGPGRVQRAMGDPILVRGTVVHITDLATWPATKIWLHREIYAQVPCDGMCLARFDEWCQSGVQEQDTTPRDHVPLS